MMSARKQAALVRKLLTAVKRSQSPQCRGKAPCLIKELVVAVLAEEMTPRSALIAVNRVERAFVDWNEVRASSLYEIAEAMNDGVVQLDRARRIQSVLCRVFDKLNDMSLDSLAERSRTEAKRLVSFFLRPPKAPSKARRVAMKSNSSPAPATGARKKSVVFGKAKQSAKKRARTVSGASRRKKTTAPS